MKEQVSERKGVSIINVENQDKGLLAAKEILYREVNNWTNLFLSGGSTPKELYRQLATERRISPKTVLMVDERRDGSNYAMISGTGLTFHLSSEGIKFYPMVKKDLSLVEAANDYNRLVGRLMRSYSKNIGVLGIGTDGHTASLPPGIQNSEFRSQKYVIAIEDFPIGPHERVTLTFKALSEMSLSLILAFGKEKKKALQEMFEEGSLDEVPARFYVLPQVAKKTLLITDQKI